jgi:hypothetical protein
MRTIRRALALTHAERWAFLRAWWVLLFADLGLRLIPFARLERRLAPSLGRRPGDTAPDPELIERLVWATRAAVRRHLYPMRCLPRALCLRWLLGRHGVEATLRIGVSKRRGDLVAHAWVERGGQPVGDVEDVRTRFVPLRRASPRLAGS